MIPMLERSPDEPKRFTVDSRQSITLISCVGKKSSSPQQAGNLYQSSWFLKASDHAESNHHDWYIISAKYGLIHRNQVIEPYEKTLNDMPIAERRQWAIDVFQQILKVLPDGGLIRIFAGDRYRQFLVPLLKDAGYRVEIPLEGKGIGQQLAWFDAQNPKYTELSLFDLMEGIE